MVLKLRLNTGALREGRRAGSFRLDQADGGQALRNIGAAALHIVTDEGSGDVDKAEILASFGRVLDDLLEQIRAAAARSSSPAVRRRGTKLGDLDTVRLDMDVEAAAIPLDLVCSVRSLGHLGR